jgi:hypothetical protein
MNHRSKQWIVPAGALVAMAWPLVGAASGCGSSDGALSFDGGLEAGPDDAGGGQGSDAEGRPAPGCLGPDAGPLDAGCIIDDMVQPNTETGGYWYTYSDRTFPFGTTLVPGYQGSVDPPEGVAFPPNNVPAAPPAPGPGPTVAGIAMTGQRTFSGGGLTLWGAGAGFDFLDLVPADAGAPDAADAGMLGVPVAFDGSAHAGIAFWGISNMGASQRVGVHLADSREAAGGGVCDPSDPSMIFDGGADLVKNPTECGVDFVATATFTGAWTYFPIPFADFGSSQTYSGGPVYPSVDAKHLFYLHFQVNNPGYADKGPIAPEPPWSVSIAYVTWYDGP